MENDKTTTKLFSSEELRRENIHLILQQVSAALDERGYNAVNQIAGYLVSNDPAYISSHNNARSLISTVDR
jgi:uncharacterized protein (UPF0297 family)